MGVVIYLLAKKTIIKWICACIPKSDGDDFVKQDAQGKNVTESNNFYEELPPRALKLMLDTVYDEREEIDFKEGHVNYK